MFELFLFCLFVYFRVFVKNFEISASFNLELISAGGSINRRKGVFARESSKRSKNIED